MPEYRDDPMGFTKEVSFGGQSVYSAANQPAEIHYAAARRIIAISSELKNEKDRFISSLLLNVVKTAGERAFEDYREATKGKDKAKSEELFELNKEFYESSKTIFNNMVDGLEPQWQALKVLYNMDPEKAIWYFDQGALNEKKLQRLLKDLDEAHTNAARTLLAQVQGFNKLPEDVKNRLIEQHAYVAKLNYDLLSIPTDNKDLEIITIRQLSQQLNDNIQNAIKNNKSAAEIEAESAQIKARIEQEINAIRSAKFKQQLVNGTQIPIGLGALAWFTGFGVPTALAIATFSNLAKAHVETSEARMPLPKLEAAKELANEPATPTANFLNQADALWRKLDDVPPEQAEVEIRTINADVKESAEKAKDFAGQKAGEAKDYIMDQISGPLSKLRKVSYTVGAVMLVAAAILFPTLFIAIGVIAAAGLTYSIAHKIWDRSKPAPTILGPIVDKSYSFLQKAGSAIANAANLVFVQPFKALFGLFSKPDPEPTFSAQAEIKAASTHAVEPEDGPENFMIPEASLNALNDSSPVNGQNLAQELSKHFQRRVTDLVARVEAAKRTGNKAESDILEQGIAKLENDWRQIKNASRDPQQFCAAVGKYLETSFQTATAEYTANAPATNFDLSKEKKTMLLGSKASADKAPNFKMEFEVDYAAKQKEIEELIQLKSQMSKVRRDVKR